MKVLICGTRDYNSNNTDPIIKAVKESGWGITEVVSGGQRGIDRAAILWAIYAEVPCHVYPAPWRTKGISAGPLRNAFMLEAESPDAVIAIPGPKSAGTYDMINKARAKGIPVHISTALIGNSKNGTSFERSEEL